MMQVARCKFYLQLVKAEVEKAIAAENAGADTLMELSVGGDLDAIYQVSAPFSL